MKRFRASITNLSIVLSFGLIPAVICQFFAREPTDRYIKISNFRYGKDPSVIRCNRGDRLHLTFSTEDTGHSFFLEEFDVDVKVSPAMEEVAVFRPSDPSIKPYLTSEIVITAQHSGIMNYINSRSNFRCHVWCGPMHAFEQGKLVIFPNTLLFLSLGCLIGIAFLWIKSIFRVVHKENNSEGTDSGWTDLLGSSGFLRKILVSRWPQVILILSAMVLIYIVIMTSLFGTKVSGRNLGVLLMWAVWLFVLVSILTPLGGRIWCTICPLPFFGDLLQRRSLILPEKGRTKDYNNRFYGFFLKWPAWLSNDWLRLIVFLILATFSTTLVAIPKISGITVLMLLVVPTLMSVVWELRAFCRYVCPVSVFVGPFSKVSFLALRNKSQAICDQCKPHFCQKGNQNGWACPYGINVGELKDNSSCGLCLECLRSCSYENVSLFKRPFGYEHFTRDASEACLTIAIFTVAIVYSVLYLGPWPVVRDYINILDKNNWDLFGIYTLILWTLVLIIMPAVLYLLSYAGSEFSGKTIGTRRLFLANTGSLLPLGLMIWIAFVVPMLFVNVTFIVQSLSDPFGWGWDFFGTANIPWKQFVPQYIPYIQSLAILAGYHLSLRNIRNTMVNFKMNDYQVLLASLPLSLFITAIAATMIFFFTN